MGAHPILDKEFIEKIDDNKKREALTYCNPAFNSDPKLCFLNVKHEENGRRAHFGENYFLLTGQPNIIPPYTKKLLFQLIGVTESVTHTAHIIVTGNYLLAKGQSYALPTHYPVMILRDPPGGLSYASYKNVATTIKIAKYSDIDELKATVETKSYFETANDLNACTGGGVGAIILACKTTGDNKNNGGYEISPSVSFKWTGTRARTDKITVTWSYDTSKDPMLAGPMSDVFVVPNINVLYDKVTDVAWNAGNCTVTTTTRYDFNFDSKDSKPSFAFYSRWHIMSVKLPELKASLAVETDERKRNILNEGIAGWDLASSRPVIIP